MPSRRRQPPAGFRAVAVLAVALPVLLVLGVWLGGHPEDLPSFARRAFVADHETRVVDEAIRRIVESQRPYPAFPRALAREFDVIEIRRTWYFDSGIRLQ